MDQVKFVDDRLLKAIVHKFYLSIPEYVVSYFLLREAEIFLAW